ncbi:MAG: FkbM family methyltransferase [Desulfatitalea sp.]|nr:FkbM family methyltransferase [Desulfatitalea sp.]
MNRHKLAISQLFEKSDFPADAFYADKMLDGREIIIYGAGEGFHWIVEILMRQYGFMPSMVLDRVFKQGDTIEGIPAYSPLDYRPTDKQKQDAVVIISVGKQEYHVEIIKCLEGLGFKNIIFMMDIYEIHNPFRLPSALQENGFKYYLDQKDRILTGIDLLSDEQSREIYLRCLKTHMQRKPLPLPSRPRQEQYFPRDIKLNKGYSKFINCGAYDGDTVRLLNKVHGKVDDIVCFETEPGIYKKLVEFIWKKKKDLVTNSILALPCAAYHHEKLERFISGGGLGSRISDNGDVMVQCVSLDHALAGFKPTFICMDVEGAEPEVLKGAERLLRANRPDLGICVYHAPHHLWEIPLYLNSLSLDYRLYLRNYTTFITETVLYATSG